MYLYVSEIFPTEIRPIGMGFSLFGQFAGNSFSHVPVYVYFLSRLSQLIYHSYAYPLTNCSQGFQQHRLEILSRHHLLVCIFHSRYVRPFFGSIIDEAWLIQCTVIYFFFPETARLTLEEIAQNFGEEVAVRLTDQTDEEKAQLDHQLAQPSLQPAARSGLANDKEKNDTPTAADGAEQNLAKAE